MAPSELSLSEIRLFMVNNGGKVTNHELVKYFRKFLTNPSTQSEARKQFKTYVNILSTIKNEGNEKYLVLRKKYLHTCPSEDNLSILLNNSDITMSPGSRSTISESDCSFSLPSSSSSSSTPAIPFENKQLNIASPHREPPPYKPPPQVLSSPASSSSSSIVQNNPPPATKTIPVLEPETKEHYKECVDEFKFAMNEFHAKRAGITGSSFDELASVQTNEDVKMIVNETEATKINDEETVQLRKLDEHKANPIDEQQIPIVPPRKRNSSEKSMSREMSKDDYKENVQVEIINDENEGGFGGGEVDVQVKRFTGTLDKQISVREATQKFNRIASEEEAKIVSPPAKQQKSIKKPLDVSNDNLVTISSHPKSKEWLVSSARGNYQELAKLASEHPELIKLQDPTTGYTALHWAAKHGNEDVVKLIAGSYKANVNARTNGGYTPLHLAMQFGKQNILELLCNVYKADRDALDWSGQKPLDYLKQRTSVSATTFSKIKARKKHSEKDLGFLRIGSLNVRVKKTTEAFSNFLGVGNNTAQNHQRPQSLMNHPNQNVRGARASAPPSTTYFEKIHKHWGSADNLPRTKNIPSSDNHNMPPPKQQHGSTKSRRPKRLPSSSSTASQLPTNHSLTDINGYRSVPTTPNQIRSNSIGTVSEHPQTESDSDSACGFDSNWHGQDDPAIMMIQQQRPSSAEESPKSTFI